MWFRGIRVPIYVFWSLFTFGQGCWSTMRLWIMSFHSWRLDGVRDKGSGDTTAVDIKTLLEAFLKNFWTQNYFLQLSECHDFLSISFQIKGILLYVFQSHTVIKMKIIHTHRMFRHVCTIFMSWKTQECSCNRFFWWVDFFRSVCICWQLVHEVLYTLKKMQFNLYNLTWLYAGLLMFAQ